MDEQQVDALFGDLNLLFSSYYKYTFYFTGTREGYEVTVSLGGDHQDIYRLSVSSDEPKPFEKAERWNYISIKKDGTEVFSKYDPYA